MALCKVGAMEGGHGSVVIANRWEVNEKKKL
jgi:hypothetical protein